MSILNEISSWLQQGRAPKVKACVQQALDEGIPAGEILEQGLLDGMNIIGQKEVSEYLPVLQPRWESCSSSSFRQ